MNIIGKRIILRPAKLSERKKLYEWMAESDITRSIMGPPAYPDAPVPSWKEFRQDYNDGFFKEYEKNTGKCFIILAGRTEVGTISYDLLSRKKKWVVLDIWLRSEKYCGHGYGAEALNTLCQFLYEKYEITSYYISPSLRNRRAIASYMKAGFSVLKMNRAEAKRKFGIDVFDYADNIMMKKTMNRNNGPGLKNMSIELIAPCGMNCSVCSGYLALKNDVKSKGIGMPYCAGCRPRDKKCSFLKKRCKQLMNNKINYCYECKSFPCDMLLHIDKRYKTNYRMSMINNLEAIKDKGVIGFLKKEVKKWKCPGCGGVICCHNGICFSCGLDKLRRKKEIYRW